MISPQLIHNHFIIFWLRIVLSGLIALDISQLSTPVFIFITIAKAHAIFVSEKDFSNED